MKNLRKTMILILVFALLITGCTPAASTPDSDEKQEQTTTQNGENQDTTDDVEEETDTSQEGSDVSEGDTTIEEKPVDEPTEEELLNEEQKNSVAMLNYLATLSQEINASKNSRMFLEEAYASLINNTNPEKVNELTESHMSSLLDIIEKYRLINVKRERLQYIYDQNKAMAIKEAVPNPVAVLSAASSLDLKRLTGSVIYMAVDSYSSYKSYNNELDNEFLQDGWALDDEEAANLHDSRKRAFMFMIEIVREDNLPGELALSESAVETFVKWKNNENVDQRLQFLESEENTYKAFGNYWLELAECYYEKGDYEKCLQSVKKYEELQSDIFRKDYYLAQIMPKAIVAASEVYSEEEYITVAEKFLRILMENTESTEWSLRYFAAQMYLDLYAKTNNGQYMTEAYNIALNNVNYLVEEQKNLNDTYLAEVKEVSIPDDATKAEKKQIKEYNKSLKTERKTELSAVYEPLVLNCDLLFALAEKMDITASEKSKIEGILEGTFLVETYANRYTFDSIWEIPSVEFEKTEITLPASLLAETSTIKVTVTEDGKYKTYNDWTVKKVEREGKTADTFNVVLKSEKAKKQEWSGKTAVKLEIIDGENYESTVINFKVSNYKEGLLILPDKIEFKQVK